MIEAQLIKELMDKWDEYRQKYVDQFGFDEGVHLFFMDPQILGDLFGAHVFGRHCFTTSP